MERSDVREIFRGLRSHLRVSLGLLAVTAIATQQIKVPDSIPEGNKKQWAKLREEELELAAKIEDGTATLEEYRRLQQIFPDRLDLEE